MKLAIVGWRKFNDFRSFETELNKTLDQWQIKLESIEMVISGGAMGTDSLASKWAKSHKIPLKVFYPDWDKHGKKAGPLRNSQIVDECTHIIAFPSRQGRGTQDSIRKAKQNKKIMAIHWIGD